MDIHFNNNDIYGQDGNLLNIYDEIVKAPPTMF